MKRDRKYRNCRTGQITPLRAVAWDWYHDGDTIECYVNGRMSIRMIGEREMGLMPETA